MFGEVSDTSPTVIPEGADGGGEVIVWDRGRWKPEGDPARGLKKGRLDFSLQGTKLKGRWHLVRMGAKPGEKRENWLLIKGRDDDARTETDPDILEEAPGCATTNPRARSSAKAA